MLNPILAAHVKQSPPVTTVKWLGTHLQEQARVVASLRLALDMPRRSALMPIERFENDRRSQPAHLLRELAPPYAERLGIAADGDRRTQALIPRGTANAPVISSGSLRRKSS